MNTNSANEKSVWYLANKFGELLAEIGGGAGFFWDSEALWESEDAAAILTWSTAEAAEAARTALEAHYGALMVCGPRFVERAGAR